MRRYLIPLALFLTIVVFLGIGLNKDPRLVPSPLIGKQAPDFSLPKLRDSGQPLTRDDLLGKVSLLNVWATWCVACRAEHGILLQIARDSGIPIYGLNYKDVRSDALQWLEQLGDPYVANAFDVDGRVGIDFGVYGVPETYVVDPQGVIAYKQIGPITPEVWKSEMLLVVEELERQRSSANSKAAAFQSEKVVD
ncbi:MAG: DsbE family thiol:disulfide interchange protein [Gammaproteobacteria bacterium]|nr:DsbE family thiol:disulfide interchange protein [Gammaproteobacteria bacterium]